MRLKFEIMIILPKIEKEIIKEDNKKIDNLNKKEIKKEDNKINDDINKKKLKKKIINQMMI